MKYKILGLFLSALIIDGSAFSDEEGPVCPRCVKIREYNAAHPENNYYWYDDYLKDKKEDVKKPVPPAAQDDKSKAEAPQK